ncbi:hypothetical protein N0V82_006275 [Gnomoniopsis sp. IMI 355080]|nr:hypothetical protein N0V82_006275 [Gnomoniopsis sp. IMI 355080]
MTAGVAEPSPPLSTMAVPDVEYIVPPPGAENDLNISSSPRAFKSHKYLPHPRQGSGSTSGSFGTPESKRSSSGSQSSHVASIHTLRHQRRQISGGELPPTPPAHSRTSSSSKSISISNITPFQTPAQSSEDVQDHVSPSTPPNQRSPPTPEVTPPRPDARSNLAPERPTLTHRIPSKSTTTDSRTESFRTALESPEPEEEEGEEEEDSNPTLRPAPPSARTSQITVRAVNGDESKVQNGLVIGAESKYEDDPHELTPKATGEFNSFDGEWGHVDGEVEQEWDDNLARNVTVKKRRYRSPYVNGQGPEIVDDKTVSQTNAAKAVRGLPLQGRILTYHAPEAARSFTAPEATTADTPPRPDARRNSAMSSKSTASTIVEAILVEAPPARRNRTLRHVKRVDALRDSVWQSPLSSVPSIESPRPPRRMTQPTEAPRESYASNSTVNSISSRKARREVWKSGAVPVVVVPDRHSSTRSSSQERSLRSASSQPSRRSQSISSVPLSQVPTNQDLTPYFDRPPRRSRRTSESDGSAAGDQRTIDFPPVVPRRTSSLSAPTSRNGSRQASINGSRTGSLTAESLQAHNESLVANETVPSPEDPTARAPSSRTETSVPAVTISSAPSYFQLKPSDSQSEADGHKHRTFDSRLGSPLLPSQTTPFSQASVETSGTAAEISQAMAVSIDRHQNRSVLMVHHRPSESSDGEIRGQVPGRPDRPSVTTTDVNAPIITTTEFPSADDEPITPPQKYPHFSLNDIESPLRNPREPPEPPVLQFIPATPSGLTPAEERPRLLGNFYDAVQEDEKPARGLAVVRRALSKRRNSYGPSPSRERPGLLTRTLSLSKNIRKETVNSPEADEDSDVIFDDPPRDETRLHPDWRPSYYPEFYGDAGDGVYDMGDGEGVEELRYPPIDNRPKPPKRSLSDRMKHTFAIMPVRSYHDEYMRENEPERRTIRRDPSGTLRVVKHRGSVGSLRAKKRRPETAPEAQRTPIFPRKYSLAKLRRRGSEDSETESQRLGLRRTWSLTQGMQGLSRRVSEKRREKRSDELRKKISAPKDCRDGVEKVIRSGGLREDYRTSKRVGVEPEWM